MGQADNILEHGHPRVGWLSWAGMPDDGRLAATLVIDESDQIWVRVPFMQQIPTSQVERWFEGTTTRFNDDPDRTLYTYKVPDEMAFVDHDGPVILVGCQSRGYNSALGGAGVGRISVTAAVIGGRVFGYSNAHGLRTEIPGLRNWFGISSVTVEDERDSRGLFQEVRLTVRASEDIPLAGHFNLHINPDWAVTPTEDIFEVSDRVYVETQTDEALPLIEHLKAHQLMRDIVDLATWVPTGFREIKASRQNDTLDLPDGLELRQWRSVKVPDMREPSPPIQTGKALFGFQHIGAEGVSKWIALKEHFHRAIPPLMGSLDFAQSDTQGELLRSSIGLEALGYQLAIDGGKTEDEADHLSYRKRLDVITAALPFPVVKDDWPKRAAEAYNGLKHANRQMPKGIDAHNVNQENVLVFRIWAAHSIGVPTEFLQRTAFQTRQAQSLAFQGLGP